MCVAKRIYVKKSALCQHIVDFDYFTAWDEAKFKKRKPITDHVQHPEKTNYGSCTTIGQNPELDKISDWQNPELDKTPHGQNPKLDKIPELDKIPNG